MANAGGLLLAEAREMASALDAIGCAPPGVRRGYTYLLADRREPELVKIGKAGPLRLLERMKEIQHMCPRPLALVRLVHGTGVERLLHERFRDARQHGEWFSSDAMRGLNPDGRECAGCAMLFREPRQAEHSQMRVIREYSLSPATLY